MPDPNARAHDIVLFGATGFTGKLVAEYLAKNAPRDLKWALAGRSREKLEAVRAELAKTHAHVASIPILIADARDIPSLEALVKDARVVCTTVGPYMKHGRELVAACADRGTHYCDLTGEVPFVRDAIDRHDARAKETGARIVCCCGFDSIPSDLGTYMIHAHARSKGEDGKLAWVKYFAGKSSGAVSGGTIASMLNLVDTARGDRETMKLVMNPYALDPDRSARRGPDGADQVTVRYDADLGEWTGPFLMAAINTRVVRRSNALLDRAYGEQFRYSEVQSFGGGPVGFVRATAFTAGVGVFLGAAQMPAMRGLLEKVLPAPGEGPSKEARDNGFFFTHFVAETAGGKRLKAHVEGKADPGYGETAKMLSESAMCLARDADMLPKRAGVLTPASAMGDRLLARLRTAGMVFDVAEA